MSTNYRIEKDFLGEKQIPADAYYGVQTQRGKDNFHITGTPMSSEPYFVMAFGYVKKAAAMANRDLGVLDGRVADAIIAACDRLIAGEMRDQFITDFIQGGAGTSTNMNANEVIANLALEQLGHEKGEYQYVNPNDHVNFGQSTNDVYPTAFRLSLILRLSSYMEALRKLQSAFFAKGKEFERVLKMGRTHLQDAVPMSLGQEFHGWGTTIGEEVERIADGQPQHPVGPRRGGVGMGDQHQAGAGFAGLGHQQVHGAGVVGLVDGEGETGHCADADGLQGVRGRGWCGDAGDVEVGVDRQGGDRTCRRVYVGPVVLEELLHLHPSARQFRGGARDAAAGDVVGIVGQRDRGEDADDRDDHHDFDEREAAGMGRGVAALAAVPRSHERPAHEAPPFSRACPEKNVVCGGLAAANTALERG